MEKLKRSIQEKEQSSRIWFGIGYSYVREKTQRYTLTQQSTIKAQERMESCTWMELEMC